MITEAQERRAGRINIAVGFGLTLTGAGLGGMTAMFEAAHQAFIERASLVSEMDIDPRTPMLLGASVVAFVGGHVFQEQGQQILDDLQRRQEVLVDEH